MPDTILTPEGDLPAQPAGDHQLRRVTRPTPGSSSARICRRTSAATCATCLTPASAPPSRSTTATCGSWRSSIARATTTRPRWQQAASSSPTSSCRRSSPPANDALALLAEQVQAGEAAELRDYAERFRAGVVGAVDPALGLAVDTDLRPAPHGCAAGVGQVDGLAGPALAGGTEHKPGLTALPAPHVLAQPDLARDELAVRGLAGASRGAGRRRPLRRPALEQLAEGSLGEYYEPFTGEWLGSADQSWTAAAALDGLC